MDHTTTSASANPERQRGWKAEWVRQFLTTRTGAGAGADLKVGDIVREFRRLYPEETLTHANVLSALGGRQPHELAGVSKGRRDDGTPIDIPRAPRPVEIPTPAVPLEASVATSPPVVVTIEDLKDVRKALKDRGWRAVDVLDFLEGRDPDVLMKVLTDIDELGVG